jgi:hypothetical protein
LCDVLLGLDSRGLQLLDLCLSLFQRGGVALFARLGQQIVFGGDGGA